jgi:hypothetical protein
MKTSRVKRKRSHHHRVIINPIAHRDDHHAHRFLGTHDIDQGNLGIIAIVIAIVSVEKHDLVLTVEDIGDHIEVDLKIAKEVLDMMIVNLIIQEILVLANHDDIQDGILVIENRNIKTKRDDIDRGHLQDIVVKERDLMMINRKRTDKTKLVICRI